MPAPPCCAYCRRHDVDPTCRPFCSHRCKMADLGRWLAGDYRLVDPSSPAEMPADEAEIDQDR